MATAKKAGSPVNTKKLEPAAPEATGTTARKRKRLAKAFTRPLDKSLKNAHLVREKFAMPGDEYERLLDLKKHLADQGLPVKKSELVRAGIVLLAALNDDELMALLAGSIAPEA